MFYTNLGKIAPRNKLGSQKIILKKEILSFLLAFIPLFFLQAQNRIEGTDLRYIKRDTLYKLYMNAVGSAARIYNGAEYVGTYPGTRGTPFFEGPDFTYGSISYEGIMYKDISMAYDLVRNELVVKNIQNLSIVLDWPKVDSFQLKGHMFVRADSNNKQERGSTNVFFDQLLSGPIAVLARRTKMVKSGEHAEDPMIFAEYTDYFIHKENTSYKISDKNDLLNLFKDKKEEVKKFWKEHNLSFRNKTEEAIVRTAGYYTQLKL